MENAARSRISAAELIDVGTRIFAAAGSSAEEATLVARSSGRGKCGIAQRVMIGILI
jgi:hypothetical protein